MSKSSLNWGVRLITTFQSGNSLTINYQILINFGMYILNGVLHIMYEVQLSQRGSRAQTWTLQGVILQI